MARVRTCRVCGCTDDRACRGGCHWLSERDDLCSACEAAQSHLVRMSRAYDQRAGQPQSVARCACGWTSKLPVQHHRKQDRRIREHWQCIVEAA